MAELSDMANWLGEQVEPGEMYTHTITPHFSRRQRTASRLWWLWWRLTGKVKRTTDGWRYEDEDCSMEWHLR